MLARIKVARGFMAWATRETGLEPCHDRDSGLSLVELLVAVVLLAVGALGAVTMQRTAVQSNNITTTRSIATSLARQLLETSENLSYWDTRLDETTGFVAPDTTISPANPIDANGQTVARGYTRTWDITDGADETNNQNLKVIRARVQWTQPNGVGEVVLATLKAQ